MAKIPGKGSVQWFEHSRRRCVDHLRALLSLRIARDNAKFIVRYWQFHSAENNSAMHTSCVIAYCRPFTEAKTKSGKIRYPTKRLSASAGFDKELHDHILDLRDRLVAHSDYGVFPSTMYLQTLGDERHPLVLGINVKGVFGIESYELAVRYERHISICTASVEETLNHACKELAAEARIYPTEFDQTHNIPEVAEGYTLSSELTKVPRPTGPASRVANPSFADGLSGYRYITLTHQISLAESGKYSITHNGISTELIVSSE